MGFIWLISNILHTDKRIKLAQAPKSQSSLLKLMLPIEQGIGKLPKSLSLVGNMLWIVALLSAVIAMV